LGKEKIKMSAEERRRAILEVLCTRRFATEGNLAFEFGVSTRTIYNDILILSCRYPIYTKAGGIGGGGVFVEKWYKLDMKFFTEQQLKLIERLLTQLDGEDYKTMINIIYTFAPWVRGERTAMIYQKKIRGKM